jgi:nitroreductase
MLVALPDIAGELMDSLLELIKTRVSTPKLGNPVPSRQQLDDVFACAQRAPDHGRLRPWRFHVLTGDDLTALGELYVSARQRGNRIRRSTMPRPNACAGCPCARP